MNKKALDAKPIAFREWLQAEFISRCKKNPKYSLRGFARYLNMDSSSISQILSGKRSVSKGIAEKICHRLSISPLDQARLIPTLGMKIQPGSQSKKYHQLTEDAFSVISDWHHYAILELTFTKYFSSDHQWMARILDISVVEVTNAVERLERLGLIHRVNGRYKKSKTFITNFKDGVSSFALKDFQRQVLRQALEAIDTIPQEEKDITSMTMAVDPKKIKTARLKIKKFRRELCAYLETGKRTQVFQLGVQLFPISRSTLKHKDTL